MVNMDTLHELKEKDYLEIIGGLSKIWNDPFNPVRNRIKLFATKSSDILKPILETK